jgi:hypothetical protein
MTYLSQSMAAALIDPQLPPSRDTLQVWHDRVKGPRDTAGRRIFTDEICEQIRAARAQSREVRAANG